VAGILGPVGAELELQGDAGYHPHREIDDKDLPPEPGHPPVLLISGLDVHRLHDGDQDGQSQSERDKEEMEKGGHRELQAGEHQDVHGLLSSVSALSEISFRHDQGPWQEAAGLLLNNYYCSSPWRHTKYPAAARSFERRFILAYRHS